MCGAKKRMPYKAFHYNEKYAKVSMVEGEYKNM